MRSLLIFALCFGMSLGAGAQDDADLIERALRSYQAKELLMAREQIETALVRGAAEDLAKAHYFRGYIYKDLYKENPSALEADSFRLASVRSFKRVISVEERRNESALSPDAANSLKYLAATLYNDAAFKLDEFAFERADAYFNGYIDIQHFLGRPIEDRRQEFEAYASAKKRSIQDTASGQIEQTPTPASIEKGSEQGGLEEVRHVSETLPTISERYLYLSQFIDSDRLQLSRDELIQLNYLYGKLCMEMFRMNAATENPYPYFDRGIEAIDRAIALDTEFNHPKLATLRKRLEKLRIEVDAQQEELKETRRRKEIEEDEDFLALDETTKALKFYQAKNLLQAKYHIDRAMEDDSLARLPKTSYFAGYIYKDLFKLHKLDGSGHPYRLRSMDAFFCVLETEGGFDIAEDVKNNLKYLSSTIYNDAAFALDTSNFSVGQSLFKLYKLIISRIEPETDLTKRDVEFNLYLAHKYTELLDTLPQWDTNTAQIITDIYVSVLEKDPENTSARYNGYEHAMKSQKFKNQLLIDARRENALAKAESRRQRTQLLAMGGGLVMVLLLAGISFRAYRQKQKDNHLIAAQKSEVEQQREQLEEKNKEITDSITYAKRIQEAILPPTRLVKQYLSDSFILYKPKDIVAGDFYWMEAEGDWTIFAAADCTGHGVPGAMVSVVCSNALNRAVREFGLLEPAKILDKSLAIVIERFEQSEEDVKDGMDISLCAYNSRTKELQWAGAQNPLWIITQRNIPELQGRDDVRTMSANDHQLYEVKADKQPIGKFQDPQPFTHHSIQLEAGDSLYIFSDGYPDQFGGDKGKKLKTKAFKELLLSLQEQAIQDQKQAVDQHFEQWRGDLEQVDDVCVIGVKIV